MRDSHSWWAGRKVQTDDGEQGIILDRVRALRRLSRRQLARMILEKDYLEIVQWDDGKLELVHENYLLDPETHTWAPVVQLRPGHASPRRAVAVLGVAFACAVGAAGGDALSAGLPQTISSASSVFSVGQTDQTSPTGRGSRMATNSQLVPPGPSSTSCPEPPSPQPTSMPTSSPPTGPEPTGPVSFYKLRPNASPARIPRPPQPTGVTPARCG